MNTLVIRIGKQQAALAAWLRTYVSIRITPAGPQRPSSR